MIRYVTATRYVTARVLLRHQCALADIMIFVLCLETPEDEAGGRDHASNEGENEEGV